MILCIRPVEGPEVLKLERVGVERHVRDQVVAVHHADVAVLRHVQPARIDGHAFQVDVGNRRLLTFWT